MLFTVLKNLSGMPSECQTVEFRSDPGYCWFAAVGSIYLQRLSEDDTIKQNSVFFHAFFCLLIIFKIDFLLKIFL